MYRRRERRNRYAPHKSQLALHLEAITQCGQRCWTQDHGCGWHLYGWPAFSGPAGEALGITPRYVDGTSVGGAPSMISSRHAVAALHHHLCNVAVVSHGESGRSGVGVTRAAIRASVASMKSRTALALLPRTLGMITTRHMHEYGTTLEQWAQVAVSTRAWAALNWCRVS